jgi:Asp-tRNA(Asn)/Glu-tRNA(Gln) amidotransferase C subunit
LSLKKSDFKENTQQNLELQRNAYLSHKKLKLKMAIDAKLDELDQYLANLEEVKVIEFREKLSEYFFVLRNKVDIKRETVLEKHYDNKNTFDEINHSSVDLIEQLDSTENEFRKNLMNEIESHIKVVRKNVDEYKKQLKEMLRNNSSSENDFVKLKNECETLLNQIPSESIQIEKKFNARLNACKFEEFLGKEEKFVGELHLNNFQFEETRLFSRKVLEKAAQEEFKKGNLVLNSHIKKIIFYQAFTKVIW